MSAGALATSTLPSAVRPPRALLRLGIGPPELFGALSIALAQLLAAVGPILDLVPVGIVVETQLERIDVRRIGELGHRTCDRRDAFRPALPTHVGGRVLVELDQPLSELAVGAAVEQARPADEAS